MAGTCKGIYFFIFASCEQLNSQNYKLKYFYSICKHFLIAKFEFKVTPVHNGL